MKFSYTIRWLIAGLILTLAACGGGGGSSGGGGGGGGGGGTGTVASISVSPTSASIAVGATQQFTATAKDSSGNTISGVTFTWASSSTAVATISSSGLATGVAAGSSNITASASGVTSPAATLAVTAPPAKLAITTASLPNGTDGAVYSATLQASGGTAPYTWSLSSGTLPAGLTLNANTGAIAGTPTATGTSSFAVKVTDSASPAASVTANLSITINAASSTSVLTGQYAFLVSNYNSALVGSVTLNGSGQVTGGTEDIEAPGAGLTASDVTITSGIYTVGSDNRGTLSYTDANGKTFTFAIAIGGITSGVASEGQMIEFDTNPLEMTGSLALQTPSAFALTALTGPYALGWEGWDSTPSPQTAVGSFTVGSGAVTSGLLDLNDSGTVKSATAFTGSIGSVNTTTGRSTMTLTLTGGGTETFTFYVVAAGQWLVIGPASGGFLSGQVLQQTGGPFSASSLSGNTILVSQSEDGVPAPNVTMGQASFGSGGTFSATVDQNDDGSLTLNQTATGTYSLTSAANGRFTLTPSGAHTLVGYLVAPNRAFLTESSSVTPSFATLEPQATGPFSNATLQGNYFLGTLPRFSPGAPGNPPPALNITSGVASFNGSGGLSGTFDINSSGVLASAVPASETLSVTANGRATTASGDFVLWIVSPTKAYAMDTAQGQPGTPNPSVHVIQR